LFKEANKGKARGCKRGKELKWERTFRFQAGLLEHDPEGPEEENIQLPNPSKIEHVGRNIKVV